MASAVPYALGVIGIVAVWAVGLDRLGVLTPPDVRAWHRLSSLRGLAGNPTRLERAAARISTIGRIQDELDLERLLATAGRSDAPAAFIARCSVVALAAFATALIAALALRLGGSDYQVPPVVVALAPVVAVLAQVSRLRRESRRSRQRSGRTLGDMMMLVAVLTDGRGLQLDDAVQILARCARTGELDRLVSGGWRRLLGPETRTTLVKYDLIARRYGIEEFSAVTEALSNTYVGMAERDIYTRVAQSVYQQRLVEARQKAARARILVTLPIAGMLVPLLILLGAPTFVTISSGLGAH